MSEPSHDSVTARAEDLPRRTPEDIKRLRKLAAMSDEQIAADDPDNPPLTDEQLKTMRRQRSLWIETGLAGILDAHSDPDGLVNDLLRRYQAELELETIDRRLRGSSTREAV